MTVKKEVLNRRNILKSCLHHVLKDICLCVSVAVSLGFADYAVVLKQEDVAVVTSSGRPNSWSPFPHLEGSLVLKAKHK